MSDEKTHAEEVKKTQPDGDEKKTPEAVPYERFAEVNERMKKAEAELEAHKKQIEDSKNKELEEQGKFKELLESEKKARAEAEQTAKNWTDYEKARREALISQLPEDQRAIYSDLPLEKLEKHVELVVKSANVKTHHGGGGLDADKLGYASYLDAARAFSAGKITKEQLKKIEQAFKS